MKESMMNLTLWIVAGLLAAVFLFAGSTKLFIPRKKLAEAPGGGWVLDFSAGFVKALGALEILGAVGLILPALLDVAPVLVPLAALGLGVIMVGAAAVEFRRQEFKHVLVNLTYLALIAFVAWGRFVGPESFIG
jgi:DoxX-like family